MNKQRKVLITITYNEMGIIIDTKAEEVAQPNLQPTCNQLATDCISRQAAVEAIGNASDELYENIKKGATFPQRQWFDGMAHAQSIIENLPSAKPEQKWIPIKWRDCTKEDREKYGFSDFIVAVFDCEMPDDEQEILVTTSHGFVEKDVCYIDDGYSLDSGVGLD